MNQLFLLTRTVQRFKQAPQLLHPQSVAEVSLLFTSAAHIGRGCGG